MEFYVMIQRKIQLLIIILYGSTCMCFSREKLRNLYALETSPHTMISYDSTNLYLKKRD